MTAQIEITHKFDTSAMAEHLNQISDSIEKSFANLANHFSNVGSVAGATTNNLPDSELVNALNKLTDTLTKQKEEGKEEKNLQEITKSNKTVATGIMAGFAITAYKLGSQFEELGSIIGKQTQAVNESPFNAQSFVQSQISAQLSNKYGMAGAVIEGGATIAGALAGMKLGAGLGSVFGLAGETIGAGLGGIIGYATSAFANNKLNQIEQQRIAASQFSLSQLDQAYYLNLMQGRYGNQVGLTGNQITTEPYNDAAGNKINSISMRLTQAQQQLINQGSPALTMLPQVAAGTLGNVGNTNLASLTNDIYKTALATNVSPGQITQFTNQAFSLAKLSNNDTNTILKQIREEYRKYGGDTVQNLEVVKNLMQNTNMTSADATNLVFRSQLAPALMQSSANFAEQGPLTRYTLRQLGKSVGLDVDRIATSGFSKQDLARMGNGSQVNAVSIVAELISQQLGVPFGSLQHPKILQGAPGALTDIDVGQGPPSTQLFTESLKSALSNLQIPVQNVNASQVNLYGMGFMGSSSTTEGGLDMARYDMPQPVDHSGNGVPITPKTKRLTGKTIQGPAGLVIVPAIKG